MANQNGQFLDLVNVVSVTVLPTPAQLGEPIINSVVIYTNNQPSGWVSGQTFGVYKNDSGVITDFGANSDAAAMASYFFAQAPNPLDTDGYLVIIPLNTGSSETVRQAVARIGQSVFYYAVLIDNELAGSNPTEFAATVALLHGMGKLFIYTSSSINDLNSGSQLDLVRQASEFRGRMLYYGTPDVLLNGAAAQQTQMYSAAYAARGLCVDFDAVGESITMHGKQLVGPIPDQTVGQTQLNLALAAGIDTYVSIAGVPGVFSSGANDWFDQVYNTDWFSMSLQVAGFNYLMPISFKVPQTDDGMAGLADAYRAICKQAVTAGVLAPGTWTGAVPPGVPQALFLQNIATVGYYINVPLVGAQNPAARNLRQAVPIFIAGKFAGAAHSSDVLVQMQQ